MRRLVCIIEGKGEREAIPNLCSRILQDLSAYDWFVDQDPIRWPRGKLVDARLRRNSRSFDKLVRVVGSLCGVDVPPRPGASPGLITR